MGHAQLQTVWAVLAVLCVLAAPGWLAAEPVDRIGRSIYLDGLLASGEPIRAIVQKGVALNGAAAACVNCHRRSGLGGSEGQSNIRPVGGQLLSPSSQAMLARRSAGPGGAAARHPAYTAVTLARALREGLDATGRPLDPLMPRYELSDGEVAELHTYLQGLLSAAADGVGEREIHFSTIIAPGVHPQRRRAMLDVLRAFFRDRNSGTRMEARRRDAGHEQMYLAWRTWILHEWELDGAPETWGSQLETYYRKQPVFAVIGGLGSGSWQPVHAFCEKAEVPCVFPDVDYPGQGSAGYYSLYFSRGVALEADVLARQLAETQSGQRQIVQVFRDEEPGRLPAQALREALRRRGVDTTVTDYPVRGSGPPSEGFWSGLLRDAGPAVLVVWLNGDVVRGLAATGQPPPGLQTVYLSASLSAGHPAPALPDDWMDRLRIVDLFDRPANRERHLARMNAWLRARQIPLVDARTQANTLFAATLTGEAIAHLGENFSRDYFIERIEQMTGSSPFSSIYPHLSLGPGQRFASRGGHILGFPRTAGGTPMPVSGWLIP